MTTTEPTSALNPARWAPDPEVRGRLRYWDGTRWTPHTVDAVTASRPELPSWFPSATRWLYAACGLMSAALFSFALLGMAVAADGQLMQDINSLAMTAVTLLVVGAGAWAYTVAGSRRVDRSSLHRDPVWLLVAWFVPIVHLVFPYQLFGQIWASARFIRTSRGGAGTATSLTDSRPWIMRVWVGAWTLSSGGLHHDVRARSPRLRRAQPHWSWTWPNGPELGRMRPQLRPPRKGSRLLGSGCIERGAKLCA